MAEVVKQRGGATQASDAARLARRHLAQEGVIDRCAPSRHAGNFNHRLLAAGAHVSREFAERSLLFTIAAAQESLDYDLGIGRNVKIHCLASNQRHGLAAESTGYSKII